MRLNKLLQNIVSEQIINFKNVEIESLSHKAEECEKNSLFFCVVGERFDGHDYAAKAVENGAVCIVCEKIIKECACIQIVVKDSRIAMSRFAKNFYNASCDRLKVITVVGTNGKTTTTNIIAHILKTCGKTVAIIGTNGINLDGINLPNNFTTPDPIELHYTFQQCELLGIEYVVMEASAHAIYLNKLVGVKSIVSVFTNITNEHLDFFKTFECYANTKISYFNKFNMKNAVVNVDDEHGLYISKNCDIKCLTYGIFTPSNIFAVDVKTSMNGTTFYANFCDEIINVKTKLVGDYNVYNILGAIGVAKILNCDNICIEKSLKTLKSIDGRFNVFELENNIKVIVDFAHTPDGFEKVLGLVKKLRKGRIITLFGCVGYSDTNKRSEMGFVAGKYSDEIILTSDNPGMTEFNSICSDIRRGIVQKNVLISTEKDRTHAIEDEFKRLRPNDTFLLLGKGIENYQTILGVKENYISDFEIVKELIKKRIVLNENCDT